MTAIAGRLGEFWAAVDLTIAGSPQVATVVDVPQATLVTPGTDPEAASTPVYTQAGKLCTSLVDATLNGNVDELETTVHNTGGSYTPAPSPIDKYHSTARTYIPNFHDETLDITLRYDEEDLCQMHIMYAAFDSKLFWFWYFPDGPKYLGASAPANANARVWMGSAFVTSFSPGTPLDDVATLDLTLRLSGTIMNVL